MSTASLAAKHPFVSPDHGTAELAAIGTEFHRRGWSVGTSSNYSVVLDRDPLRLLVTASGRDKGRLTPRDFVIVDERGEPAEPHSPGEPAPPKSSAETLLHVVIAEGLPDVGAILHTHSVWGTLLSRLDGDQGGIAIEGYEMLKGLEGVCTHEHRQWVPIFENTQQIPTLAAELRERIACAEEPHAALGHGFLIRGHGLYTWGRNLFEARRHVEILEFLFECVARERMLDATR